MKKLLVETSFPILEVDNSTERTKIRGRASVCNQLNDNGRVYPTQVMAREVARMNENLSNSCRVGSIDHPESYPSVSDLALKFTRVWMDQDEVLFEGEIIPTTKGKDLEAIIRAGVNVGISSRGFASVKIGEWNGQRASIIQEDFELETYDVVVRPSVSSAQILQYEALHNLTTEDVEAIKKVDNSLYEALENISRVICSVQTNGNKTDNLHIPDSCVDDTQEQIQKEDMEQEDNTIELIQLVQDAEAKGLIVMQDETPSVIETIEVPEIVIFADEPIIENTMLVEAQNRIIELESKLEITEKRLNEELAIQMALMAVANAISIELDQQDWDSVSRLASIASDLEWANYIDDMLDAESENTSGMSDSFTPNVIKIFTPLKLAVERVQRDAVAFKKTESERYGRRILAILLEETTNAVEVINKFAEIKTRVEREALGTQNQVVQIKGKVESTDVSTNVVQMTPEQRRIYNLTYGQ